MSAEVVQQGVLQSIHYRTDHDFSLLLGLKVQSLSFAKTLAACEINDIAAALSPAL